MYSAKINGEPTTFGTSGLLYRSNKLMYDRQTRSLWNQLSGEPVMGALAPASADDEALRLKVLPMVMTTWKAWHTQHPDTIVLDINTCHKRRYELGQPYGAYFASDDTMFPVWQRSKKLPAKARIYALRVEGVPKAYPLDVLAKEIVVNDTLADTPVVLVTSRGTVKVDGVTPRGQAVTYEAGGEVRAYARGAATFTPGPDADTLLDVDGGRWHVTEEALIGPNGERAPRLSGHLAYWFGWYAFFPKTLLHGQP